MESSFMSWGLPVGRLFGISIKIHWILLFMWFRELGQILKHQAETPDLSRQVALLTWALSSGLMFFIILLHEFGHCFAARRVGGSADHVLLWPLGGLAYVDAPNHWRPQLWVAAGGPLVNVAILAIAWPVFAYLPGPESSTGRLTRYYAEWTLVTFNGVLLVFNLIPLWPLDGGRIFRSIAWGWYERRLGGDGYTAYFRATIRTVWVSRVVAVLGGLYALFASQFMLILIFVLSAFETENLRRRLLGGDRPDTFYGHDFSRGYTSLEAGWTGEERGRTERTKRRGGGIGAWWKHATAPKPLSTEDAERLDELLRKIAREGMGSLTRAERRFLEKTSRRKRR